MRHANVFQRCLQKYSQILRFHDDWEKFNALGVSQYGQMTAGSYMYIGPQGIVHGTTITVTPFIKCSFFTNNGDVICKSYGYCFYFV